MTDQSTKHEHAFYEAMRYIPFTKADFDVERQFVEDPRDEDGKVAPLDRKGYEFPDPYILPHCSDPDCTEKKEVKIPKKAYERIVAALDAGDLTPEHLSQLPLGELVPELAQHQGLLSGAARVQYRESYGDVVADKGGV